MSGGVGQQEFFKKQAKLNMMIKKFAKWVNQVIILKTSVLGWQSARSNALGEGTFIQHQQRWLACQSCTPC